MRREMRRFVRDLAVPLYFRFKYVQFHDTLNGLIRAVYIRLHEKMVAERKENIQRKTNLGEFDTLRKLDKVSKDDPEFWNLSSQERE